MNFFVSVCWKDGKWNKLPKPRIVHFLLLTPSQIKSNILYSDKNTFVLLPGLHNMRDPGILDPRHFFSLGTFFSKDAKSDWWTNYRKNFTCLGKCGSKWHFLPGTFLHSLSLLVKCYDLLLLTNFAKLVIIYAFLSHFGEILWFMRFVAFW